MYQSKLFTKTRKEAPKDEVSNNAQLLIKAGFINKEMAGVYSFLPLGLRVLNNIVEILEFKVTCDQILIAVDGAQREFLDYIQEIFYQL